MEKTIIMYTPIIRIGGYLALQQFLQCTYTTPLLGGYQGTDVHTAYTRPLGIIPPRFDRRRSRKLQRRDRCTIARPPLPGQMPVQCENNNNNIIYFVRRAGQRRGVGYHRRSSRPSI